MSDPDDILDAEIEAEDLPHILSVRKALHWAGRIWEYLTKRWLRLTIPTNDPNRGRWPEHPTWTALRDGFDGFTPIALCEAELPERSLDLVRATRYTGYQGHGPSRLIYYQRVASTVRGIRSGGAIP